MSMIEDTTSGVPGMATMMTMTEEVEQAKSHDTAEQPAFAATTTLMAAAAESGLNQLRRVRRARTQYEKLQRPADIAPGAPTPSIEGWVLFLTNLPSTTTVEDIQDLFVSFKPGVPDYFGALHEVKIPLDKDCLCPGYALVELESRQGYERALAEMQDAPITYAAQDVEGANNNSGEDGSVTPSLLPRLRLAPAFLAEEDDEDADAALDATTHATAGAAMQNDSAGQKRVRHDDEDDDEEAMTSRKDDVHGDGQHDGSDGDDDAEDGEAHVSAMPEHKRAKHESDVVVDDEEEQGGDAPATDMQDDSVGVTSSQ